MAFLETLSILFVVFAGRTAFSVWEISSSVMVKDWLSFILMETWIRLWTATFLQIRVYCCLNDLNLNCCVRGVYCLGILSSWIRYWEILLVLKDNFLLLPNPLWLRMMVRLVLEESHWLVSLHILRMVSSSRLHAYILLILRTILSNVFLHTWASLSQYVVLVPNNANCFYAYLKFLSNIVLTASTIPTSEERANWDRGLIAKMLIE